MFFALDITPSQNSAVRATGEKGNDLLWGEVNFRDSHIKCLQKTTMESHAKVKAKFVKILHPS